MAKCDVFISYRREGGYETAKHLYDLLIRDGYRVCFDIDTLRNGDFDSALLERIDECKDFMLIVDAHAFDRTLNSEFDPMKDWLRQELQYALKKGKNIIPIFLKGTNGFPDNLPSDIIGVTKKNGPEYNRYYFNDFYNKLKTQFLTKKSGDGKGGWIIAFTLIIAVVSVVYAALHESQVGDLGITIFGVMIGLSLILLIVGLAAPQLLLLKKRMTALWYLLSLLLSFCALGAGLEEEVDSEIIVDEQEGIEEKYRSVKLRLDANYAGLTFDDKIGVIDREAECLFKDENYTLAFLWYRYLAEEMNSYYAQFMLGQMYRAGLGIKENSTKSVEWYYRSAIQDFPDAQYWLGFCYLHGYGVDKKDEKEAVKWLKKAAELGHMDAKIYLSNMEIK